MKAADVAFSIATLGKGDCTAPLIGTMTTTYTEAIVRVDSADALSLSADY